MAIKKSLEKLQLQVPIRQLVESQCKVMKVQILAGTAEHALATETLDFHHRDPFDRLLIATAIVEQMTIVSRDKAFDSYPVERLW